MRDAKSFGGRQDVLLGNTTTYNLRSGADFHILVSGWDFNLDTISEDSERPKFGETYFNETAFLKIEEAIKKRLGSKKWLGYGGGYQIILIVKEQLGTNWKGAVVVDLENLIQNEVFLDVEKAFYAIINVAKEHRYESPTSVYRHLISQREISQAKKDGKEISIHLIAGLLVEAIIEFIRRCLTGGV
jgi:hypothetical protein